jgi:hypothetical protein
MENIIERGCGLDVQKEIVVACIMGTEVRKEIRTKTTANASSSDRLISSLVPPQALLISPEIHGFMIKGQQFFISNALSVICIFSLLSFKSSQKKSLGHLKFVQGSKLLYLPYLIQSSSAIGGKLVLFSKLTKSAVTNGMTLANSRLLSTLR